ncbi:MAG: hypothetical protein ACYC1W_01510 [Gemmatimonadaceae bacterium]
MPWRRRCRVRLAHAVAVAVAVCWPATAAAQWLRMSGNGGELGVEARRERSLGENGAPSAITLFTEWVALPFQGTLASPRLMTYALNLRPTWAQQRATQGAAAILNGMGASASVNLLAASPIPITVHGERSTGSLRGDFGSETNYRLSSRGATVRLQNRAFPISLDYSARHALSDFASAFSTAPMRRDETWRTWRLTGQSTKLMANLEQMRLIDGIGALSYDLTSARAVHQLRWGRGSTLATSADWQWRHGNEPQRTRLIAGTLRLRHAEALSSALALQQQILRAPKFSANTRGGSYALSFDRPRGLSGSVDVSGATSMYHNGRSNSLQVTPTLRLNAALPFGARLTGAVFAGALRRGQDFFGDSWIIATDERHVTPEGREFTLAFERADSASIRLVNVDRSLSYLNGFDFHLIRLGDLIRIAIPLSSRIRVGDAVLVSYRYELPPAPGIRTRTAGADASLSVGPLTLEHSVRRNRSVSTDGAADGAANDALDNSDEVTTAARLRSMHRFGSVQSDITRRVRQHSRNDFTSTELRASIASPTGYAVHGLIGATGTQSRMNERDTRIVTTTASVGWMLSSTFQVRATAETWMWSTDDRARDRLRNLNFEVTWSFGALETDWRFSSQQRHAATVGTQNQFFGRVRRRF